MALELWACPLVDKIFSSASSPILADDTIYQVAEGGDLFAVNANSGAVMWKLKLGIEERNSCPLFAGGRSTCRSWTTRRAKGPVRPRRGPTGASMS